MIDARRTRQLLVAAVAISLAAGPAAAQPPASQATVNTQVAQKHYELGDKLYTVGNYRQALVEFEKAYELAPRPELLFNLARCHEVLGDLERAVATYQGYLDKKPDARNRDTVKARIKNLQQRIAARPPARSQSAQSQQATAATEPPPSRWKRTAGWITAGVGAAALVTGVVFGGLAQGKSDAFDDNLTTLNYNELDAIDADGQRFETIQIVTLAVGGAALAAGGGLLLWDLLTREGGGQRRQALLTPYTTGRGAGLVGRVRF